MQPNEKSGGAREILLDHNLSLEDRQLIVRQALNTEQQDAEDYLQRSRARYDRFAQCHYSFASASAGNHADSVLGKVN